MKSDNASAHCRILVINCGSSSLKYRLYEMPEEKEIAWGEAERVGIKTSGASHITHNGLGRMESFNADMPDHAAALKIAMDLVKKDFPSNGKKSFDCIGHRYVHPGGLFHKTTRVTDQTYERLGPTLTLAPIHNPVTYRLIGALNKSEPDLNQYLVFDTSFHSTIADSIATYAIPFKIAEEYGIRKIGFHGISHQYVSEEACRYLNVKPETQRIISCHIGTGGASVCAIEYGKSINSSMGFTPLEGLVMNTRSGDIDIGLVFKVMYKNNYKAEDIEKVLNNKSGVLGLYKSSSDLRDLVGGIENDSTARTTFKIYVRRIKKYVGYNLLLLRKADILIFTDTLGVGVPLLREKICEGLGFLGISIDTGKNNALGDEIKDVTAHGSETKVLVIPTNEELLIARETYKEYMYDRCH